LECGTMKRQFCEVIKGGSELASCCLPFRADLYTSCYHNCVYCYAKHLLETRRQWYPDSPRSTTRYKVRRRFEMAFDERRRGRLNDILRHKVPFRAGANTDNFQPAERTCRVTEEFLECLLDYEYPAVFNTKATLPAKEPYLSKLEELSEHGLIVVQMSLISLDRQLLRRLEPRAPSPEARLTALSKLSDREIPTQVRLSPYIPYVTEDYEDLVEACRQAGVRSIITEYLRIPSTIHGTLGTREVVQELTGIDLWEVYRKDGGRFVDGYMRYNLEKKFEFYRQLKKYVESMGLDLFVCSEEDPSINDKPIPCTNCCGTDYYPAFKNYNSATFNNVYKILLEKGVARLSDVFPKYYSLDEDKFKEAWNQGIFERILINTKQRRDLDGTVYYELEHR